MAKKETKQAAPGRFAYEGLERAIHEKARLGIMTSLMTRPEGLSFNELKELCDLTDGNLNRHLEVLSEAGLITVRKEEGSGRGRTLCKITATGRTRFKEYLEELERVIDDAAASASGQRLSTT
jgi:DNA-binding transcriptional ArsR family regulator